MPRTRRIILPGAIYHVMSRGIERRKIFKDKTDYEEFLMRLEASLEKTGHQCFAWTLMPNHFHILFRSSDVPITDQMRGLLGGYVGYFNRKYKRSGHVFQNRYKSILCQENTYLLELVRYIHLNPLRAKLVRNMKELNNYDWSGHSCISGKIKRNFQNTDEVLCLFSDTRRKSINRYLDFVNDGIVLGKREEYTGGGLVRSIGGWTEVKQLKKSKNYWKADERILGDHDFVTNALSIFGEREVEQEKKRNQGWDVKRVVSKVCKIYSLYENDLLRKGRQNKISEAKALICYLSNKEIGISLSQIAEYFEISIPAISKNVNIGRNIAKKLKSNVLS